ncbi:hypothetical protein Q3G72_014970 [Acer saccharum]|nr:hypothetical protein Q3G72_014970 [Acer saccharum]
MSSTGEMEIIKGELMNVQENHFRNEVEDGNDSSIYTIFHVLLQCKLLCGHALGNQSSRGISGFAKNQATFVGKWDGSLFEATFVLETNTLWFWKHLVVQAHGCNVQNTGGALSVLVLFLLRSFILPKAQIPVWWSWGYLINQGLRQCYQLRYAVIVKTSMNPNVWLLEIPSITQVTDNKILRQISQLRLFKTTEHNKSLSMVHHCLVDNLTPKFIARNWRRTHLVSAGRFCPSKRSNSCLVVMGTLDFNSIIWFQCSDKDWIGVAALLEFTVLFDILLYLNPLGKP